MLHPSYNSDRLNHLSPVCHRNPLSNKREVKIHPVKENYCNCGIALQGHFQYPVAGRTLPSLNEVIIVLDTASTFILPLPLVTHSYLDQNISLTLDSAQTADLENNNGRSACVFLHLVDMHVHIFIESSGAAKTHTPE